MSGKFSMKRWSAKSRQEVVRLLLRGEGIAVKFQELSGASLSLDIGGQASETGVGGDGRCRREASDPTWRALLGVVVGKAVSFFP